MLHYRKNIGGNWQICSLSVDEAKSIQEKIIKIGIAKYSEIKKIAEEKGVTISEDVVAVILAKTTPSYESLANDYIEADIKKRIANGQIPS